MLVHAGTGEMPAARPAFERLKRLDPSFLANLGRELGVRKIRGADLERVKAIVRRVRTTTLAVYSE